MKMLDLNHYSNCYNIQPVSVPSVVMMIMPKDAQ